MGHAIFQAPHRAAQKQVLHVPQERPFQSIGQPRRHSNDVRATPGNGWQTLRDNGQKMTIGEAPSACRLLADVTAALYVHNSRGTHAAKRNRTGSSIVRQSRALGVEFVIQFCSPVHVCALFSPASVIAVLIRTRGCQRVARYVAKYTEEKEVLPKNRSLNTYSINDSTLKTMLSENQRRKA